VLISDLFTNFWFKEYCKIWLYLADFTFFIQCHTQEKEKERKRRILSNIRTYVDNSK